MREVLAGEYLGLFRHHADAIIRAWAKPFNKAATALATCHERIGDFPLEDTATIMRAGGDIASVWAQAQAAAAVIDQLARGWVTLATLSHFASVDPRYPALRIAIATAEEWEASGFERQTPGTWNVQLAGLTLSLADGAEYGRRVAAVLSTPTLAVSDRGKGCGTPSSPTPRTRPVLVRIFPRDFSTGICG